MPIDIEKPVESVSLAERAYQILKDQILQGKLAAGEKLDIYEIAAKLEISRTPIKEAFNRLTLEGLATIHRNRGTFVTTLSPKNIRDLFDVRLMIELWAAKAALQRPDFLNLEGLVENLAQCEKLFAAEGDFDYAAYNGLDVEFHTTLVEAADNPHLSKVYQSLNSHIQIMRVYWGRARSRAALSHEEHTAIVRAFQKRLPDLVDQAVSEHIESSRESILKLLGQSGAETPDPSNVVTVRSAAMRQIREGA